MSNFKKSFFGGYKKSEVDTAVSELNTKLEACDADRKRLQREVQNAESRVADDESRIADLENKLSELRAENEKLNSSRIQSETVFNEIARIYKRAYGAGREIVCDSKETAQRLLNDIDARFDEMMGQTRGIIDEYETVHRDMDQLFETLNRDINGVAQTAAHMLERAKAFAGIYGQMKSAIDSAQEDTDRLLAEYDVQASEFLNSDFSAAHGTADRRAEQVPASAERVLSEPEPAAVPIDAAEENTETNPSDGRHALVAFSVRQTGEKEEDTQRPEEKTDNTIPKADESDGRQTAGGFTQFGRKSKISEQDRSELLRKALLKNSGS